MGLFQMVVRNEAMRNDPVQIYNWRVYLLCCAVCLPAIMLVACKLTDIGLLWWHVVWYGYWHHRRSFQPGLVQQVRIFKITALE